MTFTEDLNLETGTQFEGSGGSLAVIFGIPLTPQIIGGVIGALGILGGAYMIFSMGMPAWDNLQQQQAKRDQLGKDIEQKRILSKQIKKVESDLEAAKAQQKQVLGLFADEKSLQTLLLDTSRLVDSSNTQAPANVVEAKLKRFFPVSEKPEIVIDSSFGPEVNNKLKRSVIKVNIEGTFEQTQDIMQNIERLQPLLLVKNFDSKLQVPEIEGDKDKKIVYRGPGELSTSFDLEALIPVSEEESAAIAAQAATQAPKK
ncbi:pilus assembly protein PilO [Anabaena sp. FACHB-1237]|uniref:pilus assembly protein PilO n=1 Tax=Anabaena sp. FACHB-1237 TaxID=2692769 RepID=UPI0016819836|nr:pilus assembly protein PilO [Anabaena sp. FACHB-1237]MBD2138397.1 pilus assembly protein PilO [Anabaena sp. FACHB-1237]